MHSLGVYREVGEEAHIDLADPGLECYYRPDGHREEVFEGSTNKRGGRGGNWLFEVKNEERRCVGCYEVDVDVASEL